MEQVAVVTGTSRGIGRATARRLARSGFRVVATARTVDDMRSLDRESGGTIEAVRLDLSDDSSIQAMPGLLADRGVNAVDALVNVAAGAGRAVPLEAVTRGDLDRYLAVTANGTALLTGALVPHLKARRGRVVNLGAGLLPMPLLGSAYAAKQALEALSDVLRIELAASGIRVIVVEPGMTRWEDPGAQLASYDDALDKGGRGVREAERDRYRRAAEASKRLNRRLLDRGASADDVAATIERALTVSRPRARYYCGAEQKLAAALKRLAPAALTDRILRRLARA
jgi:NAD(P)-dependent dehydrogenase (short-subunit alcohol dehydrogenase family)